MGRHNRPANLYKYSVLMLVKANVHMLNQQSFRDGTGRAAV